MKVLSYFVLVCCAFALPTWEPVGPYGGPLRPLAVAPSQENILYVVSYTYGVPNRGSRVFKSIDYGNSWNEVGRVTDSTYTYSLEVDPTNPDILYAGTSKRICKSTDGGVTWAHYALSDGYIYDIAIEPSAPSTIFAVGRAMHPVTAKLAMAFFKSTDGAMNWDTVLLDTAGVSFCITLDQADSMRAIYVGGKRGYPQVPTIGPPMVYKSTDGGLTFTDISGNLSDSSRGVRAICVHPTNDSIVYIGAEESNVRARIYRSTDAGNTWEHMYKCSPIYSLATSIANPDFVYAGSDTTCGVYKSTDAGVSWSETGLGIVGTETYGLAVSSTDENEVFAANNSTQGFYKTTNGGSEWFESTHGMSLAHVPCFTLAPSQPSTIYVEYDREQAYKSTNSGNTWSIVPTYTSCGNVCAFAVHNANPDIVFSLEGTG